MTVLSDRDIARELASRNLIIEGCQGIGPASVDVYLGDTMAWPGLPPFEMWEGRYWLPSQVFVLGTTREIITIPDYMACQVHGCSSIGRSGLFVHNAGWVDPGFQGELTLELFNAYDEGMELFAGQRIAQLTFHYLNSPARNPYAGRYVNQRGATAARPPRES